MLKENLEIKDYTLKTFLGKGGFGEVWLAEKKIEIADKKVPFALKFISGDTREVADFSIVKREINTWIDASGNKNIISVLDGFIYKDSFVIVSEYANNGSLRHWLRTQGGKIESLEKCVEIMGGILDGLTHLHSQNIIHRDLKPENVLLKGDVPCIADFGVSRIVESVSLDISAGTNTAGSPLYMSPESFERIKPAPQIDIWAAGVMLFEMLSGRTPYAADTIPGLIYEIVTKEPRSLPAEIPQSFHRVVKKALAKDVSERFATAREMRDALMRALYTQHLDADDSEATTLTSEKLAKDQINADDAELHLLKTQPMTKKISVDEIKQGKAQKNVKTAAWIGFGLIAVLAAAFGIFTLTRSSAENDQNKIVLPANQTTNVETNAGKNANGGNLNVANEENAAKPPLENKSAEKIVSEKEKNQTDKRNDAVKPDSQAKKDTTPKQKPATKKKVTLDDLIN